MVNSEILIELGTEIYTFSDNLKAHAQQVVSEVRCGEWPAAISTVK